MVDFQLTIHIICVQERLKNYKCDICDKAFWKYVELKVHIDSVHERLKCDKTCSQSICASQKKTLKQNQKYASQYQK